jgi:hypothetical protein
MSRRVGSASAENTLESGSADTGTFLFLNRLVEDTVRLATALCQPSG